MFLSLVTFVTLERIISAVKILCVETSESAVEFLIIEIVVLPLLAVIHSAVYHGDDGVELLYLLDRLFVIVETHSQIVSHVVGHSYPKRYNPHMKRYSVISMGEPAGTSPEIIIRAVSSYADDPSAFLIVTGDEGIFRKTAKDLSLVLPFSFYADDKDSLEEAVGNGEQFIFYQSSSIDTDSFSYGTVSADTGYAAFRSLESAVAIIQNGQARSLVTCPVSGDSLAAAGYAERSVFELLSRFASTDRLSNMLSSGPLNIFGLSHRRAIRKAIESVKRENIISALVEIDSITSTSYFDRSKPIGVAALNPIRPDGTWTDTDEEEAIGPAVEIVRNLGINAEGPLSSEVLYSRGMHGEFSSILVMTAGEGFAAASAASPDKAVVITWGLPFMRVGPLMETELPIAGKGIADMRKLRAAIDKALLFRAASFMA